MLKNQNNNNISFTSEEEKLLKRYLEEYNELYQKIIILSSEDFIQMMKKRLEITLKEKFNGFSQKSKSVVENFIIEKIYSNDYKYALFAKRNILLRNTSEINSHYFNYEIIPHCDNDKKDGYYVHTCGNKFQIYNYKPINYLNNNNNYQNEKIYLLYCEECDMIYKSDLIKLKCNSSKEDFYSKIIDNNESKNYHLATWKKYHCNIIINDAMKCQICHENLYFLSDINLLFCQKCSMEFDPTTLLWKCIKCKEEFIAEVKIFNPLEYKNMKICVKETIINKKKAKPKYLGCSCKSDLKKMKFFHKTSCNGELYIGELNNKKVVVCNKCDSLGQYDGYVWTCPICYKRFKNKITEEDKINNNENKNEIENEENNKKIMNRFCNYSSSNWYVRNNGNNNISPIVYNNNLLNLSKNDSKEKEFQSDMKNINFSRRNNSALKLIGKERCPSGLPSPSKLLNNIDDIYALPENNKYINNIKKINIPKSNNNYSPNKISNFNQMPNSRNNPNYKRSNRLMSNADLSETKNLDNIFNKCFGVYKNDIIDSQNILNYSREMKNDNNYLITDVDLGDKVIFNNKYKKAIVNSYSKVINQSPNRNNSLNSEIKNKRNHSNCNSIQVNIDDGIPYIKNIYKNKVIYNNKIPIKKSNNIKGINFNNKGSASTSCDSKGEISQKKIVPGQLNLQNYIIKKQIGQGSFGQILLVEDREGKQYALKKIVATSSNNIKKIKNELQILLDVQNNGQQLNTVTIYGMTSHQLDLTTYALYVLMELAYTDWEKEIKERKKAKQYYTEYELMSILFCLVKTLSILQQQNISHRDIKPQNILILKDSNSQKIYKLADFGEAKELLKGERPTNKQTLRGTELFMSPILFYALRSRKMRYVKHNPYKSDVYSFGICALLASSLDFKSIYDIRELKSNITVYVVVENYLRYKYSDSVISIIAKMLDINETTRCDFVQLEKEFNKIGYY